MGINGFDYDPSDRGTGYWGVVLELLIEAGFDNPTELSRIRRQPRLFRKRFLIGYLSACFNLPLYLYRNAPFLSIFF
jgi:hypothetical protein